MKALKWFMVVSLCFIVFGCSESSSTDQDSIDSSQALPSSLKGYELYSWQTDNEWSFALITGTNRNKAFDEVYSEQDICSKDGFVRLRLNGTASLKECIQRIPEGETISWCDDQFLSGDQGNMPDISFPDDDTLADIESYCAQMNILLQTGEK